MLLKKMLNWISYNQEVLSSENTNECVTAKANDIIGDNNKNICNVNNPSSAGDASVLDFCLTPQINAAENTDYNSEERHPICEDQKCLVSSIGSAFEPVPKLKDAEYYSEKNCPKESAFQKDQAIPDSINIENESNNDINGSDSGCCDSRAKLEISQNNVSTISSSHPNGFKSKCRPSSEMKNRRSVFTHTETKRDKRLYSSGFESSCARKPSLSPPLTSIKKNKAIYENRVAKNTSLFPRSTKSSDCGFEPVVYGTLFVFGCNGNVPQHLIGTLDTKFVLRKRFSANGLRKAFSYTCPNDEPISINPAKHFISYPSSSNTSVVVSFEHDKVTDMFQIGRYQKPPIDLKVSDVNQSDKARNGVSRFACRILVHRETHEARVYAAAFDSSKAIFLGEDGIIRNRNGEMDGFTTNGVLIMHRHRNLPGIWREVSVHGYLYPLRSPKIEATMRPRLIEETNVLEDGTLIDLCGITLLWRTTEGLRNTPDEDYLSRLQCSIYKSVPECQLLLRNVSLSQSTLKFPIKKTYIYLSCGHIVVLTLSKNPENLKGWSCPACRVIGPIAELIIGAEPGFYLDREFPSHAFRPCGHAASFKTIKYWSSIIMPTHRNIQSSLCPFCGTTLNNITKFVKIILLE